MNIENFDTINYNEYESLLNRLIAYNHHRFLEMKDTTYYDDISNAQLLIKYGTLNLNGFDNTYAIDYILSHRIVDDDMVCIISDSYFNSIDRKGILRINIRDMDYFVNQVRGRRVNGRLWISDPNKLMTSEDLNFICLNSLTNKTKQIIIL